MAWRLLLMAVCIGIGLVRAWTLGAFRQERPPERSTPHWVQPFIEIRIYADTVLQEALPRREAQFLSGILFGGSGQMDPELRTIALTTGTLHLFAVSGFNLTILANLWEASSRGRFAKATVALTGIILILFYLFLTGASPSVQRAAVFAIASRIAPLFQRIMRGPIILSWYVLIIVWVIPFEVINLSFLLTVGATLGLLLCERPLEKFCNRIGFPQWLSGGVATTLAATVGTLPLQLGIFHRWSNVFLISNIIVVPTISVLTLLGVAVLLLHRIPVLGDLVVAATWSIITFDRAVLTFFAGLPFASMDLAR